MSGIVIDENLPESLAGVLGRAAIHVSRLGARLTDRALWEYGRIHGSIILTKDSDFFDRLSLEGPPPKVVWIRTGNLRRRELEDAIAKTWPEIERLLATADLIEMHPDRLEALKFSGREI